MSKIVLRFVLIGIRFRAQRYPTLVLLAPSWYNRRFFDSLFQWDSRHPEEALLAMVDIRCVLEFGLGVTVRVLVLYKYYKY